MEKNMEKKSKKPCCSDKSRLILLGITLILVVSTFVLFSITVLKKGQATAGSSSFIIA
ncbi:MAG: hypothetical protein ABIE43_02690 [Patescibacteria group bacterium]